MIDISPSCKVMTDDIEPAALAQIRTMAESPAFEGSTIRIMPDVHAGAGCVIGFTGTLTGRVVPNVVGVDIGCGIVSANLGHRPVDFAAFDAFVRDNVPSGFSIHTEAPVVTDYALIEGMHEVIDATEQIQERVLKSLGTLGGGNHFIELGRDEQERVWLTVHTGSRNFGLRVATWHQQKAVDTVGKQNGLEWLEGDAKRLYLQHMKIAQRYASFNRKLIIIRLVEGFFRQDVDENVESVHNYIAFDDNIIRKGAIAAHAGQSVVIPWNMRDGLIIGTGLGNPEWNESAPHGAGRVMGRGQAKRTLKVENFEESMRGIWTSCVSKDTLDEAPMVYKKAESILAAIGDTVRVDHVVKPIYNFKAS
jgi:RNA-splicing ligase RtcB